MTRQLLATALLLLVFEPSRACSCLGIATLAESIAEEPILVEAEVVSVERSGDYVESATLEVHRILKGHIDSQQFKVVDSFCYQSLTTDRMQVGHTYVLPLPESDDDIYAMASCAHSGAELIDGNLYTFELTEEGGRVPQQYKKYNRFLRKYDMVDRQHSRQDSAR